MLKFSKVWKKKWIVIAAVSLVIICVAGAVFLTTSLRRNEIPKFTAQTLNREPNSSVNVILGTYTWDFGNEQVDSDSIAPEEMVFDEMLNISPVESLLFIADNWKTAFTIKDKMYYHNGAYYDLGDVIIDGHAVVFAAPEELGEYIYLIILEFEHGTVNYSFKIICQDSSPSITLYGYDAGINNGSMDEIKRHFTGRLQADVETGLILLPEMIFIDVQIPDGTVAVQTYYAEANSEATAHIMLDNKYASPYIKSSANITHTTGNTWRAADYFPEGFVGAIWAVTVDADGVEHIGESIPVMYPRDNRIAMWQQIHIGTPLETVHELLGEPTFSTSGLWSDVYEISTTTTVVFHYRQNDKGDAVVIHIYLNGQQVAVSDYKPMVFIQDMLYSDTGNVIQRLPDGCVSIGAIEKAASISEPMIEDNFAANYLDVGSEVFGDAANPSVIYIKLSNGQYAIYEVLNKSKEGGER